MLRPVIPTCRARGCQQLEGAAPDGAVAHLVFTTDYDAMYDRDLVVEAVIESAPDKLEVFGLLDKAVVAPDVILASNTSSVPIMKLAMATSRPDKVIGLNFFNSVSRAAACGVNPFTNDSVRQDGAGERFASKILGKRVIRSQDRAGFVVNALLIPYLLSAARMLKPGFASLEDIDTGMAEGCAHPMGPLGLCDLRHRHHRSRGPIAVRGIQRAAVRATTTPQPQVEARLLGRKAGRGFCEYRS